MKVAKTGEGLNRYIDTKVVIKSFECMNHCSFAKILSIRLSKIIIASQIVVMHAVRRYICHLLMKKESILGVLYKPNHLVLLLMVTES